MGTEQEGAGLAPLEPPYPEEIEAGLKQWMGRGNAGIAPLAIFRTLYRNPALAAALHPLGRYILAGGLLPPAERELLILRTCARCGAEYEWGVHAAIFPSRVGLTAGQVEATRTLEAASSSTELDERATTLLRIADELHDTSTMSDALWADARPRWSDEQVLEILAICGFYHFISYLARAGRIAFEPWQARFPAS
jgi:4-carboxymuconolactone decarboxylase